MISPFTRIQWFFFVLFRLILAYTYDRPQQPQRNIHAKFIYFKGFEIYQSECNFGLTLDIANQEHERQNCTSDE